MERINPRSSRIAHQLAWHHQHTTQSSILQTITTQNTAHTHSLLNDLNMGSTMEEIMRKRRQEAQDAYDAQWADGQGSHHPDFDPLALGPDVVKASRATEELYNAIVQNDVGKVHDKIDEGADVDFVFGKQYSCAEGYTPLMVACHRGR